MKNYTTIILSLFIVLLSYNAKAQHTFSIVAVDTETGEIGTAGGTCLDYTQLGGEEGAYVINEIIQGTGAICSQANYSPTTQAQARAFMVAGQSPTQILASLDASDNGFEGRQYGIVDLIGGAGNTSRTAAHTGTGNPNASGHRLGVNFSVQGNTLVSQNVLNAMRDGFNNTSGTLADKLMGAMNGARITGGDNRCSSRGTSCRSAFIRVMKASDLTDAYGHVALDLNVSRTLASSTDPINVLQDTYDYYLANQELNCTATISSFPYSESFETNLGGWKQSNNNLSDDNPTLSHINKTDFDWVRDSNGTPSANTGPPNATNGSFYLYTEGNNGSGQTDRALLTSPCFDLSSLSAATFTFDYHMFGNQIGDLAVRINDGSGWNTVWRQAGNKGNQWNNATIDLTPYAGGSIQLRMDSTTGTGANSDSAIDNLRIDTPQPVSCSTTIPSNNVPGYTESFENTIGNWIQAGGDDGNWLLLNQATPSTDTGPSAANDGAFFAYIEASNTVANGGSTPGAIGQNAKAIFESPCFDLTETADVFFTFDYHIYGDAIGNIALDISVTEGVWTNLFTTPNMSVNDWQTFAADLSGYNQPVKLRLVGTTGATFSSDLAIDNVRFTSPSGCSILTIYDGSPGDGWTNGIPTINTFAAITTNYNTTTVGANIDACSLLITNNATLTIAANDYANINGDITIDPGASLIIEHQGSLVQVDDDAQVINNGTTNVIVTTPVLQTRDFTVMGSPMTTETRNGVFAVPFLVLDFDPSDFIPHPDVPAGGTNWADDDGNFYNQINGATPLNPGEGYVVRPQDSYTDPANEAYTFTFSNGTLNNGTVNYTARNNGATANPNGTPNAVSNPYPSAISASAFMSRNGINELYFWEHLTPPNTGLPGSNLRFDMDDISIRNMVMGMPAANDTGTSTAPNNVIATGQGFGIRTNGAANTTQNIEFNNSMRLTAGNTTLRKPDNNTESLIIEVREDQYNAGGFTGIAFTPNATSGLDEGYDTNRLATIVSLYSHLEDGTEELGIQSREPFSSEIEIPLGFSTQIEGKLNYTIALSSVMGSILEASEISLVDLQENTTTLLSENSYTFTSDKGRNDNRFLLKFENSVLSNETPTLVDSINVYPNPTEGTITINAQSDVLKTITVTDIHGRTILQENIVGSNMTTIDISSFKSAIYFLNISTEKDSVTKKIVKK